MRTSTKTQTRPEPTVSDVRKVGSLGNFGLIHLVACLGVGGAVVLAINLIEWLR